MNKTKMLMLAGAIAAAIIAPAYASGFFTNGVPPAGGTQYPSTIPLTGNEQIPADTELTNGQNPQSEAITVNQLAANDNAQPSRGNVLIGGDGTTNLWQRGTAGTSTTSATVAWDSADRWGQWALSSAGVKVARDSTAADLPTGYKYAIALTHTNTTGGQICTGQSIESVNTYQFQGSTAELDFHASTGAGYTGGATLTAYITYGTGTDEGLNLGAFTINGGGATGFTGGANATVAVIPLSVVSTTGRFAAIASIPATATEMAVAFCYTAGTTDTNDYVALDGIQLIRNAANVKYVSATAGWNCTAVNCASFDRRTQEVETAMQQRYYWAWAETVSATTASPFMCSAQSSTVAVCKTILPVQLRAAPTVACTAGTLKRMVAGTDTTVSACAAAATTNGVSDVNSVNITATVASGDTAGFSGSLMSGNSTGGGLITASAEL